MKLTIEGQLSTSNLDEVCDPFCASLRSSVRRRRRDGLGRDVDPKGGRVEQRRQAHLGRAEE